MKKFLSLLLVVMMLVSMIPATSLMASAADGVWTLVTDLAALKIADQVIIAAKGANNAMSTTQNGNNRASTAITKSDNTATITDTVQVLELREGKTTGTFAFYTGSGYLYAASSSKNYLKTETTLSANSSWNITIANTGVATVKATGSNSRNWMRYNSSNNPPLFSCYGSGQADICLYKLVVEEENACQHANTHEEGYVAPTCTATGWTAAVFCDDCGEKQKASTEIPMIPHNIVDGVCSACGAVAYQLVTDISKLHVGSQILIVATGYNTTISTTQSGNNRPEAAVFKAEDKSYVSFGADAQILTIEAGSEAGTYAFNTGAGYLYAAGGTEDNYMRTKAELDAAGSWTIEITEDGIATIKCADAAITRNWLRYNDFNKIFSCYGSGQNDVAIYILPVAADPEVPCDHLGYDTYEGEDYVAPTCTTTGLTATVYCSNCDAVVKEQEELPVSHEGQGTYVEGYIAPTCTEPGETGITYCQGCDELLKESEAIEALGHDYEDGACNHCGEAEPSVDPDEPSVDPDEPGDEITNTIESEQYVFSNYTAGSQYGKNEEHVLSDLVTMYTTEAHFTTELRLYSSSSHDGYAIIKAGAPIKGITVNAGNKVDTLVVYGSNDEGATWTTVAEIAVTSTSYKDYSAAWVSTPYSWLKLDVKGANQVRLKNMTLQFVTAAAGECTHELTETIPGTAATCTTAGKEDGLTCVCGQNVQEGAVIEALGHAYDDDCCTRCALINPEAAKQAEAIDGLPKAGDVIIFYHPNDKKAMSTAFIPNGNGGRMGAVSVPKASGMIPYSATHTAVMTVEQVGEYFRFQMNGQYLTADADGGDLMFAALPAEGETDYSLWTVTAAETYGVVITSVHAVYNDTNNQAIEYYQDKFYPYGYKEQYLSSYRIQIGLISRIPAVVEMDGVEYASFEEAYAYDPDTTIKLLVDFDEINVTGDLYLDLNGHTVGSVTANHIYAGDSSATAEAAGTGKLTTTSPVETTETIGSTKYVALKDENGVYTFHVLDLKLSAVTLRTNKAGIYYKAELACDEVLAEQIECYGIAVSILGMPTADFENEANTVATKLYGAPEGTFTSGSITNIFREGMSAEKNAARGEIAIYGNPYIQLKDETVLMGSNGTSKSMKDVMEYLNENFASLETAEQETVKAFYAQWADTMTAWNLENLAAAIIPTIPEEEEEQA